MPRILALLLLAAPAWAEVTATDSLGREVALPAPATRVVALWPESYGHLATLGLRPVAVHVGPDTAANPAYFADGGRIPQVGGADGAVDPELVASHRPDLILGWGGEEAAALEGIAPFYGVGETRTAEDVKAALRDVAALLGMPERAEAAIAAFDARVAAYAARAPGGVTVMSLGADGADSFWVLAGGDPTCALLDAVASCPWEGPAGQPEGFQATAEAVLALDPDVIVLGNWMGTSHAAFLAAVEANPLWSEIGAVRDGRVVSIPDYPNPMFGSLASGEEMLERLVPAIFPDAFPTGPLTDAEVAAALSE